MLVVHEHGDGRPALARPGLARPPQHPPARPAHLLQSGHAHYAGGARTRRWSPCTSTTRARSTTAATSCLTSSSPPARACSSCWWCTKTAMVALHQHDQGSLDHRSDLLPNQLISSSAGMLIMLVLHEHGDGRPAPAQPGLA